MPSIAGYLKSVKVSPSTSSTVHSVISANSASFDFGGELLDDTDFTSTGYRSRLRGLKDYSLSITAFYGSTDTALENMKSALIAGTALKFQYLPDGSKGFVGEAFVESFNNSGDVGGIETVEISLQSNGVALTTI